MKFTTSVEAILEYGKRVDGNGRPHQEDAMFPAYGKACARDSLFVLCDGMGGHAKGEVASTIVCETMGESLRRIGRASDFTDEMVESAVSRALQALDKKAAELGFTPQDDNRMGTTMTLLKLHHKGATIAHIGDSRVYHIRPGATPKETRVLWHTQDHSLVNDLVRLGEITPEQAWTSKQRNVITRAMQPFCSPQVKADIRHISDIRTGDFFYLCTDGMLEEMDDEQLCYYFSPIISDQNRAQILIQATKDNKDNHSAFIIKIEDANVELSKPSIVERVARLFTSPFSKP